MANKDELKNGQVTPEGEEKGKEPNETKPETKGGQEEKEMKEKKPWSTKKKVGVGAGALLLLTGGVLWIKNKFFSGSDEEDDSEE